VMVMLLERLLAVTTMLMLLERLLGINCSASSYSYNDAIAIGKASRY
jgi:hypothetical protein